MLIAAADTSILAIALSVVNATGVNYSISFPKRGNA